MHFDDLSGNTDPPTRVTDRMSFAERDRLVLAVASGKGGVGKTMLAAAIAAELAKSRRTLLVDLDFFNRGLAGLLPSGNVVAKLPKPAFLLDECRRASSVYRETEKQHDWSLVEVAPGLCAVAYPDVTEAEMAALERLGVEGLAPLLRDFLARAADAAGCSSIVLDCHGGPDVTSFAACVVADRALLVSEPDGVTLYGTRHFLRKLERGAPSIAEKLRLVFNKVGEGSWSRLQKVYVRELGQHFGGHPLLAAFPLEPYVDCRGSGRARAPVQSAFCTLWFPNSLLARKVEVLVRDLLFEIHSDHVPRAALQMPSWVRAWRRRTLGRVALPLRPMTAMLGIFCVAMLILGAPLLEKRVMQRDLDAQYNALVAAEKAAIEGLLTEPERRSRDLDNALVRYLALRDAPLFAHYPAHHFGGRGEHAVSARREFFLDRRREILAALSAPQRAQVAASLDTLEHGSLFRTWVISAMDRWTAHQGTIVVGVGSWLAFAFLVAWTEWLDRAMTRCSRQRRFLAGLIPASVLVLIWGVAVLFLRRGFSDLAYAGERAVAAAFTFGLVCVWLQQLWVAWRDCRYHGRYLEPAVRIVLAACLVAIATATSFDQGRLPNPAGV